MRRTGSCCRLSAEQNDILLTADLLSDVRGPCVKPRGIKVCGSRKRASIGIAHDADSQHAAPEMIPFQQRFLALQPTAIRGAAGTDRRLG